MEYLIDFVNIPQPIHGVSEFSWDQDKGKACEIMSVMPSLGGVLDIT